jgi:hypothetical protein
MAGPSATTQSCLFDFIAEKVNCEQAMKAIPLESTQTLNLKSVLKYVNQYVTNRAPDVADEETSAEVSKVRINIR